MQRLPRAGIALAVGDEGAKCIEACTQLAVVGLGLGEPLAEPYVGTRRDSVWQWVRLSFGQLRSLFL